METTDVCEDSDAGGCRELTEAEMEQVAGGSNEWVAGGATIVGLAAASTAAVAGFGIPIGLAMIGLGVFKAWRRPTLL